MTSEMKYSDERDIFNWVEFGSKVVKGNKANLIFLLNFNLFSKCGFMTKALISKQLDVQKLHQKLLSQKKLL